MNFWVLIPARVNSTRLPNKPLLDLAGKPMIAHVIQAAKLSGAQRIVVATDDDRVIKITERFDAEGIMTDVNHPSGSDRILEALKVMKADDDQIVVNLQGDEPLIPHKLIRKVAELKYKTPESSVATVATPIKDITEIPNSNCVKVILNMKNEAIYFSRSVIPYNRNEGNKNGILHSDKKVQGSSFVYLRHLGIYSFTIGDLKKFVSWGPCLLELNEKLEQLRWLWNKKSIKVIIEYDEPAPGVDTEQDLKKIRLLLKNK
ncbi:MAG: 3-deoxy-D-manno-octulosonate cytidylyltransferase [Betaproteobacteria bacterium TMED156]|nr:MAG: 3-deoxy-D-manno-octulosonate cytidylyltransferase [Betaproteobacteria bacterium TMED156]|tara:strand:- start:962 stop:1741 length:780 start_codon:yes stop_codon:yes gene_type:complete